MMKKLGFTLAEVLITLGIIGVVAALTAPALVANGRNQANAAKLSVAVSNLENALNAMLVSENVSSLFQTRAWQNAGSRASFAGNLGRFLRINGYRDLGQEATEEENGAGNLVRQYYGANNLPSTMTATGSKNMNPDASTALTNTMGAAPQRNAGVNHIIESKNGITYFLTPNADTNPTQAEKDAIINQGGALFNEAADVYIDVNGSAAPNTLGRDIFAFYLGDDGILYPIGGLDVSILDNRGNTDMWNTAGATNRNCRDGAIVDGYGCTARVIAEGYQMNY